MASERLTIDCDDCMMAGSGACADCLVTFVVGGTVHGLPPSLGPQQSPVGGRAPAGGRASDDSAIVQPGSTVGQLPGTRSLAGEWRSPVVHLSADQADAVRALAGAGLVGAVRFVRRAAS